jgi:membrane protease YdiL (CAAX protease family)
MRDSETTAYQDPGHADRPSGLLHLPLVRIVVGLLVCFGVPSAANYLVLKPLQGLLPIEANVADIVRWALNMSIALFTYYSLFKRYEHRDVYEISRRALGKYVTLGFLAGFALLSLTIAILALLGYYRISSVGSYSVLFRALVIITLLAVMEEILFRGVVYRITEEALGTNLALLISTLLFGVLHVTNANANLLSVASAGVGGILLAITFTLTRSLWVPIFLHTGWNFAQVFYGTRLSGMDDFAVFLNGRLEGPVLLTGGDFGVENSLFAILVCLVASGILYRQIALTGRLRARPASARSPH